MGLGFNLGKTFAQELSSNKNLTSIKKRIDAAYRQGFTTVRIPVQWTAHMDSTGHLKSDSTIKMVYDSVDYAYRKKMYIILGSMGNLLFTL